MSRPFFHRGIPDSALTLLDVPYISQEGANAYRYANDCGVACVAMVLAAAGQTVATVNALAGETSLAIRDNGLTCYEVAQLATRHQVVMRVRNDFSLDNIRTEIAAGRPVIMLIHYGAIMRRQNQADFGGHFVVVVGMDADNVYVNDPDWWGSLADNGHNFKIPNLQFINAIQLSPVPFQGVGLA